MITSSSKRMRIPATPPHHRRGRRRGRHGPRTVPMASLPSTEYRRPLHTSRLGLLPRSSTIPPQYRLPPPLTIHRHPPARSHSPTTNTSTTRQSPLPLFALVAYVRLRTVLYLYIVLHFFTLFQLQW